MFEKHSNFMKIRPVGAELLHADGRTDMKKLIVFFAIFTHAPKIVYIRVVKVRGMSNHKRNFPTCVM